MFVRERKFKREMNEISGRTSSLRYLLFLSSLSLQFLSGLSDGKKADAGAASSGSNGMRVVIICIILLVVVVLSVFLFKFWQKKKREEQYARLLKLFEEDDELELELGLQD